jgi:hypothetical protein
VGAKGCRAEEVLESAKRRERWGRGRMGKEWGRHEKQLGRILNPNVILILFSITFIDLYKVHSIESSVCRIDFILPLIS